MKPLQTSSMAPPPPVNFLHSFYSPSLLFDWGWLKGPQRKGRCMQQPKKCFNDIYLFWWHKYLTYNNVDHGALWADICQCHPKRVLAVMLNQQPSVTRLPEEAAGWRLKTLSQGNIICHYYPACSQSLRLASSRPVCVLMLLLLRWPDPDCGWWCISLLGPGPPSSAPQ